MSAVKKARATPVEMDDQRSREYLRIIAERMTLEAWACVVDKAVEQARNGDQHARQWLSLNMIPDADRLLQGAAGSGQAIQILITDFDDQGAETTRPLVPHKPDSDRGTGGA